MEVHGQHVRMDAEVSLCHLSALTLLVRGRTEGSTPVAIRMPLVKPLASFSGMPKLMHIWAQSCRSLR